MANSLNIKPPYKAEERNGYWIAVDTRSGEPISYPATKAAAKREASFMNQTYLQVMAGECA